MDTVVMNESLQENSYSPHTLAKKAKKEIKELGFTSVKCPKCGGAPELTMTPGGERTIVTCECGYVHDVEINF